MNKNHKKNILLTAALLGSSLVSAYACADKKDSTEKKMPDGVMALSSQTAKDLKFSDHELAVVFAVDSTGKVQAFAKRDSKFVPLKFPMHAENIAQLETLTMFRTSNPHLCWMSGGTKLCIDFHPSP